MKSNFNNVLLRGDIEVLLKFHFELAERQVAHFCEFGDLDFLPEVIVNLAECFVEFLFDREFLPMLMIFLDDAHDSEDFVQLGDNRKFTGEEPRGNALAIQD